MLNIIRHDGPEGPTPLLIAHGLYGSGRNWGVIAKRLSSDRTVLAVDMRNHGTSPWSDSHTYPAMAADLAEVIRAQARLVAGWLSIGFIHGVMNTDNTAISGETIDYGPCAFMDTYHPQTVFSSIDARGRYAYDNQAHVIVWNMAQLATALVPLMPDQDEAIEDFTALVHAMPDQIEVEWRRAFGRKIGLAEATAQDAPLIADLLARMAEGRADFTNTFRGLIDGTARDQFLDRATFDTWEPLWRARIAQEADPEAFIPRNHRVEQMIEAAVAGDYAPFERLLDVLARPYIDQPDAADLKRPPTPSEVVENTFCGT